MKFDESQSMDDLEKYDEDDIVDEPLENKNVKRATVGEILLYPRLPSHSLPPPVFLLFPKNKRMEYFEVVSLIPLT